MIKTILVTLLLAAAAFGQYTPNTPESSLIINGVNGPTWPIIGVRQYTHSDMIFEVRGGANCPLVVLMAHSLTANPLQTPLGQLELDPLGIQDLFYGQTDSNGLWTKTFRVRDVPMLFGQVPVAAYQAYVFSPNSPQDWTLSASTSVSTYQNPVQTVVLASLSLYSWTVLELPGEGNKEVGEHYFPIYFYGEEVNVLYISRYGFVTTDGSMVNSGYSLWKPTFQAMDSLFPIIAPFWGMHNPTPVAGEVLLITDQTDPYNRKMTIKWVRTTDMGGGIWSGGTGQHTFSVTFEENGDIVFEQDPMNQPSINDWLVGIGRGRGEDPLGQHATDLSYAINTGYVGLHYEGIYEGFKGLNMVAMWSTLTLTWDLTSYKWRFIPNAAGEGYHLQLDPP